MQNEGITMVIVWYDRNPDFTPNYDSQHHGKITGKTPAECMSKYRAFSIDHDLSKYTHTEISGIY